MKSFIIAVALTVSFLLFGAPSWSVEVTTGAYEGDVSPSTAKAANYSVYYCTAAAAQTMFSANSVAGIESYLARNFVTGKVSMGTTDGSVAIDQGAYYGAGQYTFIEYLSTAVAGDDYFAVAFYGDTAFRVFGNDNDVIDSGSIVFDDQAGGTIGNWRTVPEPTSGLLILLGCVIFSLRRNKHTWSA